MSGSIGPTGFLPAEDQGAFFAQIALPEGASTNRTVEVARQAEEIMRGTPGIIGVSSITGYNFLNSLAQSNSAFLIMTLASIIVVVAAPTIVFFWPL